jgi:hypothetical protein
LGIPATTKEKEEKEEETKRKKISGQHIPPNPLERGKKAIRKEKKKNSVNRKKKNQNTSAFPFQQRQS